MSEEVKFEVGKVYMDSVLGRMIFFGETKISIYRFNFIVIKDHTLYCLSTCHTHEITLAEDQTHDITIDIKPNKRQPQVSEVWEANITKVRFLLTAKSPSGLWHYVYLDPSDSYRILTDNICNEDALVQNNILSDDQSHSIILAKQS